MNRERPEMGDLVSVSPNRHHESWSLAACLIGTFLLRAASSITGSTLQLYFGYIDQHYYPLPDTARGVALAVFFLPELVGSPIFGAWSDRLGRKWFILLGSILGGVGVQLTAMTTDLGALTLMRLLGGASTASAVPATLGLLSSMTSHSESLRGRMMGLFQIATLAGILIGMLTGGRLWDLYHQTAFSIDAVVYLASLAVFALGIREAGQVRSGGPKAQTWWERSSLAIRDAIAHYRTTFASPTVLRFAPAFLAINMILGMWMNHLVGQLVATDREFPGQLLYGLLANNKNAGTDISLYGALIIAIFAIGAFGWSFIVGRFRRTSIMLIDAGALFFLCANVFALNHAPSLHAPIVPTYLVLAAIGLLTLSGMMPAALTYLADVTEERREDRGAIMGLYTIFLGIGGFIGTVMGGPFADWRAIDGILLATVGLGLIALALLVHLHRSEAVAGPEAPTILSKE